MTCDHHPCDRTYELGRRLSEAEENGVESLEQGAVLFLPRLPFAIEAREAALFSPAILSSAKNASFDPASGRVGGTTLQGENAGAVARAAGALQRLRRGTGRHAALRHTAAHVRRGRASFRPAEIAGRASSWRKDDTRLHVDSFPATPVQGRRILRVFSNVNPAGRPRPGASATASRPWRADSPRRSRCPGREAPRCCARLHVTKSRRSAYDALMLQLHDRMKGDAEFQERSPQTAVDFPAGTTWMAFTDQVPHAAMAGQYQLEQTFLLPVTAMIDESRSPLRILERLKGRPRVTASSPTHRFHRVTSRISEKRATFPSDSADHRNQTAGSGVENLSESWDLSH